MDIRKERDAFEVCFKTTEIYRRECVIRGRDILEFSKTMNGYFNIIANEAWRLWQAAKAQAVPEGFVLIKASDRDREVGELIDERDHFENQAEQLKDKLQDLYGVDFGEHSNCNFPFQNAIDFDDSDFVLVPREPTEWMMVKMRDFWPDIYEYEEMSKDDWERHYGEAYKAMIKAAQEQK